MQRQWVKKKCYKIQDTNKVISLWKTDLDRYIVRIDDEINNTMFELLDDNDFHSADRFYDLITDSYEERNY